MRFLYNIIIIMLLILSMLISIFIIYINNMDKQDLIIKCLSNKRYQVDETGEIYCKSNKGQTIKPICKTNIKGYKQIQLFSGTRPGVKVLTYLHIAIYIHFKGKYPEGLQIDHIDGNNLNNHINNLQAISPQHNAAKAPKPKTKKLKLNKQHNIEMLYSLYLNNTSQNKASQLTGINRLTVRYIFNKFKAKTPFKYAKIDYSGGF